MPAVPIGAAGEKFLKFDTFSCIFKAFFRHFFANFSSAIFDNKTKENKEINVYCICTAGEKFENCPPFL